MSRQSQLSRRIENARKRDGKKSLMFSPEKEQCPSCGRAVISGPMGLSRHFSNFPQCSLDYYRDPIPHRETTINAPVCRHSHGVSMSHADGNHYERKHPDNDEESFGNSSDVFDADGFDDQRSGTAGGGEHSVTELEFAGGSETNVDHYSDDSDEPATNVPIFRGASHLQTSDVNHGGLNGALFSVEEEVQVDLLRTLQRLKCPMIAYDEVMKWAVRSCSRGHSFHDLPIRSRKTVVDNFRDRVDYEGLVPIVKRLYLPYSNCTVEVVYFNAHAVFNSFLSCSDLNRDENYIFHDPKNPDIDPFARPSGLVLGDINTGRSYLKTYDLLVKKAEDMLLPCVLAIDKTTCDIGGGGKLSLEPIVISYGLMKHDVRKTPAAMRVLGFINTSPVKQRSFEGGDSTRPSTPLPIMSPLHVSEACYRLNEYHLQIDFILRESGYLGLQESGLKWDLHYGGKSFPVHLHTYVPFIVGDTVGHDSLCGHYQSRTMKVAQLCRACVCPTAKSGYSKARSYAKRTPYTVNQMVVNRDFASLKANSQQFLINAFDSVRFGAHNNRGIFGACPGEILHLVLLGWFKNVLDSFFKQIGKASESARRFDILMLDISNRLFRQSDRVVPKTTVTKGFTSGANIPGHEYAGCIFVMLISLSTTHFSEIFKSSKKSKRAQSEAEVDMTLSNPAFVEDWRMFLSSLLEWHAWLKQTHISRLSVKRSGLAVSSLMRSLKFVAPRLSGAMGNTTIKTHLVLHMEEDILDFGVPEVTNSSYAESAHITISKDTTRNTQKRQQTFTLQAAMRYVENLAIRKCVANVDSLSSSLCTSTAPSTHRLQGKKYTVETDADGVILCKRNASKKKKKGEDTSPEQYHMNSHISSTLAAHVLPHTTDPCILHCHTEYKSANGQIYRANPNYQQKPWFDYALVDWHGYDEPFPARIHVFLNLCNMKHGSCISIPHSGQCVCVTTPGFYALIESYHEVLPDSDDSDEERDEEPPGINDVPNDDNDGDEGSEGEEVNRSIFRQFMVDLIPNSSKPKLYVVHVDSIVRPTVAIADTFSDCVDDNQGQTIPDAKYIVMMLPQSEWAKTWDSFIHRKHRDISTKKMAESDESGDEGFTRMERIVPPSPQSRRTKTARRTKAAKGKPRKASAGASTNTHKRQRTK